MLLKAFCAIKKKLCRVVQNLEEEPSLLDKLRVLLAAFEGYF